MLWVVWDVRKREIQREGREVVEISCTRERGVSPIAVWQRVVECAHHVDESELGHHFRRLHA